MNVMIRGMQLPKKCCKCPILHKNNSMCPLLNRRVVEPGKRRDDCPLEVCDD